MSSGTATAITTVKSEAINAVTNIRLFSPASLWLTPHQA